MTASQRSYRQILRSTSIIGGSSAVKIVIGVVRLKVLAILLGPAGVGLAGLYTNIMTTAGTLTGFGLGSSGVRQIAETSGELRTLSAVRRALWYANIGLGIIGMLLLWLMRKPISQWVFKSSEHSSAVGWLGVGVFFTLVAGSQTALLRGLRRIRDFAALNVIGTFFSSLVSVLFVYFLGEGGIIYFIVIVPFINVLVAIVYTSRLPKPQHVEDRLLIRQQLQSMLRLGAVFMTTALMQNLTQLLVRTFVTNKLGIISTGHFEAAWTVSMTYIGFILTSMAADYYPKLTAVIRDKEAANRMVNQQALIALLLAGPIIIGMLSFAPLVISLLYSSSFAPTVEVLRWQIMGTLFKVFAWPIGFILLAQGEGRVFFITEALWNVIYLLGVWFFLPKYGLMMTGCSYLTAYVIILIVIYFFVRYLNGFRFDAHSLRVFLTVGVVSLFVFLTSFFSSKMTYYAGSIFTSGITLYSFLQLKALTKLTKTGLSSR